MLAPVGPKFIFTIIDLRFSTFLPLKLYSGMGYHLIMYVCAFTCQLFVVVRMSVVYRCRVEPYSIHSESKTSRNRYHVR